MASADNASDSTAVSFDLTEFREFYPKFSCSSDTQLMRLFSLAMQLVGNVAESSRKVVLQLLVCHLAELESRGAASVGAIASVSEGSVSASFALASKPQAQWFQQTQAGATAWQIMSGYTLGGRLYHGCSH